MRFTGSLRSGSCNSGRGESGGEYLYADGRRRRRLRNSIGGTAERAQLCYEHHCDPEYFDSVGTRVLMGRGITVQDTATSPHVAVVNEDFVRALFKPGENPIGHRFTVEGILLSLTKL